MCVIPGARIRPGASGLPGEEIVKSDRGFGAGDGSRTRDIKLGKLAFYP